MELQIFPVIWYRIQDINYGSDLVASFRISSLSKPGVHLAPGFLYMFDMIKRIK
jgi:hypothetical protein